MRLLVSAAALVVAPAAAHAHAQTGVAEGLIDGLMHPVLGPDHFVAMVAVGLWGAQLGRPLLTALPIAFPMMMTVGALWGVAGMPLPASELGVALSALALGLFVLRGWRPPVWAAVALVGAFAVFHGYAHGTELPGAADPTAYGVGFVTATGLLHALGIGIGEAAKAMARGERAVRLFGAGVAAVGAAFTASAVAGLA